MHQDRPHLGVAHIFQHRKQVIEIVSIDRTDVIESEFLEQRAARHEPASELLYLERFLVEDLRQPFRQLLTDLAQRQIRAA